MTDVRAGRNLLHSLRERGFTVRSDGERLMISPGSRLQGELRKRVEDRKADIVAALRRQHVERVLDLVPVDPETGLPDLPTDELATERQVHRLHDLSCHPAWGEDQEAVEEIVDEALTGGLSQLGAWGLIAELGRRIDQRSPVSHTESPSEPEGESP